jgi:hypothetical protein
MTVSGSRLPTPPSGVGPGPLGPREVAFSSDTLVVSYAGEAPCRQLLYLTLAIVVVNNYSKNSPSSMLYILDDSDNEVSSCKPKSPYSDLWSPHCEPLVSIKANSIQDTYTRNRITSNNSQI